MRVYQYGQHVLIFHNLKYWDLQSERFVSPNISELWPYLPTKRELYTKKIYINSKWLLNNLETIVICRTDKRLKFFVPDLFITVDSNYRRANISGFYSLHLLYALVKFINKISK